MSAAPIPKDIMKSAEEALDNMLCNCKESCGGTYDGVRAESIKDIAKAILAERERCAAVIEKTDFIEQATTLTTKTAIAYWSVRFGELIRSGANPQASSQNFTPAPMNVSLPDTDERSGEGANAGGQHETLISTTPPQTSAVEPVSSSTDHLYLEDVGSGA